MATEDFPKGSEPEHRPLSSTLAREVPDEEIAGIRDVSFPVVMRGYERAAVDAYVTRVNGIIAELQVSRSPQSAIRHALDQVSEETRGILERAHETADGIAARSRSQAADRVDKAESEARALVSDAEARLRELDDDADALRRARDRLIEDTRAVAEDLRALAEDAAARFSPEPEEPEEPESDTETEPEAQTEPIDADAVVEETAFDDFGDVAPEEEPPPPAIPDRAP
jgi:DivIVA domain-containing protein